MRPQAIRTRGATTEENLAGRTVEAASLSTLLSGVDPVAVRPSTPATTASRARLPPLSTARSPAPKSVSLLHALGPADAVGEVRAAHERAVAGTLGYLERHVALVRRGGSVPTGAGPRRGVVPPPHEPANDPHLHTHLVVANLAPDAGGRWSALDARALFANVGVAGALYRAELRYEISRRLAVSWQARARGSPTSSGSRRLRCEVSHVAVRRSRPSSPAPDGRGRTRHGWSPTAPVRTRSSPGTTRRSSPVGVSRPSHSGCPGLRSAGSAPPPPRRRRPGSGVTPGWRRRRRVGRVPRPRLRPA